MEPGSAQKELVELDLLSQLDKPLSGGRTPSSLPTSIPTVGDEEAHGPENRIRIPSPPLRDNQGMQIRHSRDGTPKLKRGGPCRMCREELTPQWRRGPQGPKTLCNACGLRDSRQKRTRLRANWSSG